MDRTSLIFKNPREIELRKENLPAPAESEVLVKTRLSAISAGTELLVYRGQVPAAMQLDEQIEGLTRPFEYPLKYGYASVGQVVDKGRRVDKGWLDQPVFCFHPHESHYVARPDELLPVPPDVAGADALFLANMETAVNFLMDARPIIGEDIVVFGQGVVGLLTTALLTRLTVNAPLAVDPFPLRRNRSLDFGARLALDPQSPEFEQELAAALAPDPNGNTPDVIFELSGNPAALNQALNIAGFGSRIVVGSWYGTKTSELVLGANFHRNRIRISSSQVSTLAPEFSARWTKSRRLNVAWDMVRNIHPARLITHRYAIQDARQAYELLDQHPQKAIQVILTYE